MKLQLGTDIAMPIYASVPDSVRTAPMPASGALLDRVHEMGQLTFALNGVMVVSSPDGHWVVPPTRALWLAPNVRHRVRTLGRVRTRTITLHPVAAPNLPQRSCVLNVTPLLRELLNVLDDSPCRDPSNHRNQLLTELLLEEMSRPCSLPLSLPTPREPRVGRICSYIQENLDDNKSLQDWSVELGLHSRTLHRLFIKEVGMSFVQWRQQAKLLAALEWLAEGRKILSVALDLGYQTQSAFTVMFRRSLGITPSDFIKSMVLAR
ncbi:MAG: helix-turn-helix transcriptional regulator [Burkholderiaceae bacterium]|nr:helix-turn-helix transcriptional regulator [Burkholderiaceae bacterium]